jgi:iron complex outermembrane receptor protein
MFKRRILGISSAVAILFAPVLTLAPQLGYTQQIEEIVVSVRRKNESLQEVPISVSTLNEEQITRYGINNTADVIKYTAGLDYDTGLGAQDTRVVIRGLSPTRGRSNVAILVDGIDFTGEAVSTAGGGILVNQQLLDIERVEVVKGPQSALYGRSAFAGAIQYVSKKPSLEEADGSLNVQFGNGNGANSSRVSAAYGGPVSDSFGLRVNGLAYDDQGFYQNSVTGGEVGGSNGYGVSLGGIWDGGGVFSANGRVAVSRDEYQQQAGARVRANTLVDINDSVAVQEGQTNSLIYTSGLQRANGFGYPDCTFGVSTPDRSKAIQSCGSTPKTLVTGQIPDADQLSITLSDDPSTNGGDYKGTGVDTLTSTLNLEWDTKAGLFTSLTGFAGLRSTQNFDAQYDVMLPGVTYTNLGYTGVEPLFDSNSYIFTLPDCGYLDCSRSKQVLDLDNDTRLFSQDLRYTSQLDGPVNFAVGGLLWKEKVKQEARSITIAPLITRFGEGTSSGFIPNPDPPFIPPFIPAPLSPPAPGQTPIETDFVAANQILGGVNIPGSNVTRRNTTSYSLYGQFNWDLDDTLSLTLEGRWVSESLEVSGSTCDAPATLALMGDGGGRTDTFCGNAYRGASSSTIADGDNPGSLPPGTYSLPVLNTTSKKFKEDFFAPKATLTFTPTDTQMFYGSVAQGIKPGGISTLTSGAFFSPDENTYGKEKLLVYELGSKSTLFDGGVLFNATVFFQEYTDKQVGVTRYDPTTDADIGSIENAGEAETYGLELETQWQMTEYLSVGAGYAYLHSEYTDFVLQTQSGTNVARNLAAGGGGCLVITPGAPPVGAGTGSIGTCKVDLSGNAVEDVPTHSFVGNTRWESPIGSTGMNYYADASFIFKDKRFVDEFNTRELDSYWLVDVRTGLIGDKWEAILFVDNLLDDDTVKSGLDYGSIVDSNRQGFIPPSPPDGFVAFMPDPRVVGVRFNFLFGY